MKTTIDYLEELKTKRNLPSDYAISKLLGVSHTRVSNYRVGRSHFDDEMALKVAELLEIDPAEVLAAMQAERTKCPQAKEVWKRLSESLAASVLVGLFTVFAPVEQADASTGFNADKEGSPAIHYAHI